MAKIKHTFKRQRVTEAKEWEPKLNGNLSFLWFSNQTLCFFVAHIIHTSEYWGWDMQQSFETNIWVLYSHLLHALNGCDYTVQLWNSYRDLHMKYKFCWFAVYFVWWGYSPLNFGIYHTCIFLQYWSEVPASCVYQLLLSDSSQSPSELSKRQLSTWAILGCISFSENDLLPLDAVRFVSQ